MPAKSTWMEKLLALPRDHATFKRDPSLLVLVDYIREHGYYTMDVKPIPESEIPQVIPTRPEIQLSINSHYI